MEIIAGDIGATKSALAWASGTDHASSEVLYERVYASADYADAAALLQQFLRDAHAQGGLPRLTPARLTLALPGAVFAQHARLTNLDWTLDAADLQAQLNIDTVQFINDFQAAANGVASLTENDLVRLNPAQPVTGGVRAITGAGTGLGLAWLVADSRGRCRTFATEGGHIDFAPANGQQARLLAFVRENLIQQNLSDHVSWERLVSGLGFDTIYRFCVQEAGGKNSDERMDGARLTALAASSDGIAQAALDLFIDLYGAWVGNVALLYRPEGGLYIAGGVSIHLRERVTSPRFIAACTDKGRMRSVVERTPISLITNRRLGVQGAIAHAFDTAKT
ncbi:MAG: glucokinase [Thiobacillus sp.]